MKTAFLPFDDAGRMIRGGRSCVANNGMVSAGRAEAAAIGCSILEQGGNAVDAAVAVAFALGVCEPNASGVGGGGFMLLRDGDTGKCVFLDFRETAPAAAAPDMYLPADVSRNLAADGSNVYGGRAAGVPGDVAGLLYALEHYGTLDRRQVIAPAAALAREGYPVTPLLHGDIAAHADDLIRWGDGGSVYLPGGAVPPVGAILRNPDLADTLDRIAEGGRDAFYRGEIADRILERMHKDGGLITRADLEGFRVRVLEPVRGTYRGYEILSSPPPSSGGTHVIQCLNLLEHFDVASMAPDSPETLHLFSEIFKQVYSDRAAYMGDPAFVKVPLSGLLSKDYAAVRAKLLDPASPHAPQRGDPLPYESPSTTHFSVADRAGNLVAVTRTINHFFGSCAMPRGTGFLLNDEMEDFSVDPASINAPAGGKIPLSCMSPTFLLKDGKPFAVLGSPGGIRIISSVVQVISNLIDRGMPLEQAVNAPRMGDDQTDLLIYESRFSPAAVSALAKMGHPLKAYGEWDRIMGAVNAVQFLENGTLAGAADPRRDGLALGV